jgi:hypothetical protein
MGGIFISTPAGRVATCNLLRIELTTLACPTTPAETAAGAGNQCDDHL